MYLSLSLSLSLYLSLSLCFFLVSSSLLITLSGLFHFVYGASPQHILLHFPIKLLHLPIKFASFPQQIASFPQQLASFPQQIASFPQHSFSLPQHILCHFAKHRIKVFFCDLFSFLPFLAFPRQLYWWSEWRRYLTWPKKAMTKHNLAWYFFSSELQNGFP